MISIFCKKKVFSHLYKPPWSPDIMIQYRAMTRDDFFPQPGPTRVNFFLHFFFSFSVLHAHSDTFYGLKLVHSALKALTKP